MKGYTVRAAQPTLSEAAGLLLVERTTLKDSAYTAEEVLSIMRRCEHYAYVAGLKGEMVGFCSCLETSTALGPRLEIDMLGVAPEHCGRGLGTALVSYCMADARKRGTRRFRAVVASENAASRRVFTRAGLVAAKPPFEMVVYEIHGDHQVSFLPEGWRWEIFEEGTFRVRAAPPLTFDATGPAHQVHCLRDGGGALLSASECHQVKTLAYCGLWIEDLWWASERALRCMGRGLVEQGKLRNLDEVGYLTPRATARHDLLPLLREGYRIAGTYLCFEAEESGTAHVAK